MGWLFRYGLSRKELIAERTKAWELTRDDGLIVASNCLASCYRGNVYSSVLWTVWERTFQRNGVEVEPTRRWIGCDLLRYDREGWGYKDLDESMGPLHFSCPLSYLALVSLDRFGGNASWREAVHEHHARRPRRKKTVKH